MTDLIVTTLDDEDAGSTDLATENNDGAGLSLREALAIANAGSDADTITFADSLSGGTITLGGTSLVVSEDLTIDGDLDDNGVPDITIDADDQSGIFEVQQDVTATFDGLDLTGGNARYGAAIYGRATGLDVTITNSVIHGNTSQIIDPVPESAAVVYIVGDFNDGPSLTISGTRIEDNTGFGIRVYGISSDHATVTLTDISVSGNSGSGVLLNYADMTISNMVVAFNGGYGFYPYYSTGTVADSTVTGNRTAEASFYQSDVSLENTAIAGADHLAAFTYTSNSTITLVGTNVFSGTISGTTGESATITSNLDEIFADTDTVNGVEGGALTTGTTGSGGRIRFPETTGVADGIGAQGVINTAAVIGGNTDGSIGENDTGTITGHLTISDEDGTDDEQFTPDTIVGSYGTLTIDANGDWSYDLDETNTIVDGQTEGNNLDDIITVTSADGTEQDITITINGVDDPVVITGDSTGNIDEDSTGTATGHLTVTDPDGTESLSGAYYDGRYGRMGTSYNGDWSYDLDESNSDVQALKAGETLTDVVTIQTADGANQDITITINGADDDASFGGDLTANIDEFDESVSGEATVNDPDGANAFVADTLDGTYGQLVIDANGDWTYSLDSANSDVQALRVGDTLGDTVTVSAADGTEQQIAISIHGENTPATFNGDLSATIGEENSTVGGSASVSDVDSADLFTADTLEGTYGEMVIDANGDWTYSLDGANSDVEALLSGDTLGDSVTVTAADGTEQDITITIQGANDDATFGGTLTNGLYEGDATIGGTATVSDVDGPDSFTAATLEGSYGTLTMAENGDWLYSLDNTSTDVQSLEERARLTEQFTVTAADGTEQEIRVIIVGLNDAATFGGDLSGTIGEDEESLSGSATVSDVDDVDSFQTSTLDGAYGQFSIDANGDWSYDLDTANADVQALGATDSLSETFTVYASDGTEQDIEITINGDNDAASIGGDLSGQIGEDADSIAGTATVSDIDGDNSFTPATHEGTYGSLTIDANGDWVYDLNGTNGDVQALGSGRDTLADQFTVTASDGTAQDIEITITGENDAPTSRGGTVSATEGQTTAFSLSDFGGTDVDSGDSVLAIRIDSLPDAGSLQLDGSPVQTGDEIDVADLDTLTYVPAADDDTARSFSFSISDGSAWSDSATMTIDVNSVNDAPTSLTLSSDGVTENQAGVLVGTLIATDPEGDAVTYSVSDGRFHVTGNQLWLNDDVSLDYEAGAEVTVRVTATDTGGLNHGAYVSFDVIDVVEGVVHTGGSGNDTVMGGGGADTISGGGGNDTLDGGAGDDIIMVDSESGGTTVVVGGDGGDHIGTGDGNDFVVGDGATDGQTRQSLIENGDTGVDGSDTIVGGSGDDTLLGGGWDDDLVDDNGRYDDGEEVESGTLANNLWAGGGNDVVVGSGGDDRLGGNTDDDYLKGLGGNDTLYGNLGDDTLLGGDGDDLIYNGQGDDSIDGGAGNDTLWGGAGNDTLTGGTGVDRFVFGQQAGEDRVVDFNIDEDTLDLTAWGISDGAGLSGFASDAIVDGVDGLLITLDEEESVFLAGVTTSDISDVLLAG